MTSEQLTFDTAAGPITASIVRDNGVAQISVHYIPGKRFGLFAVYDQADLPQFGDALRDFVAHNLEGTGPDMNISGSLRGAIAAGTGPAISFKAEFAPTTAEAAA
jgi:hypothetical protein